MSMVSDLFMWVRIICLKNGRLEKEPSESWNG